MLPIESQGSTRGLMTI